jgi:hypothetical protein
MQLSVFITSLLTEGKVSVNGQLTPFEHKDLEKAGLVLIEFYKEDVTEMPYAAPEYSNNVAVWSAEYLYRAVQLTILRDVGEEILRQNLKAYSGEINPSVIYSADLMLRYLPTLFELAKGLAPADILVQELLRVALQFPFSSVGISLDQPVDDGMIFKNQSLKCTYIDRIIREKDKNRLKSSLVNDYVRESAGEYLSVFWPGFENL